MDLLPSLLLCLLPATMPFSQCRDTPSSSFSCISVLFIPTCAASTVVQCGPRTPPFLLLECPGSGPSGAFLLSVPLLSFFSHLFISLDMVEILSVVLIFSLTAGLFLLLVLGIKLQSCMWLTAGCH